MTDDNNTTAQWFSIQTHDELQRMDALEKRVQTLETHVGQLQNENLRLVNRILEAEIAVERYRNLLLRKNISFPFSPMLTARMVNAACNVGGNVGGTVGGTVGGNVGGTVGKL